MIFTGSIGATRKSASQTDLPRMQTGMANLPRSRICWPSAWDTVTWCVTNFCSGTRYCSAISLDMRFTQLKVSTIALRSAPPKSAFIVSMGRYFLPLNLLSRIWAVLAKWKTHNWLKQTWVNYILAPDDPRLNPPSYFDSFENSDLSHGTQSTQCLASPSRSIMVAEVSLPGNHFS